MFLIPLLLAIASLCFALQASSSEDFQCYVNHQPNDYCGPTTPSYCEKCPNWRRCPASVDGTSSRLWNMTDGVPEREIYFTEQEYFLYKQLTLDYTIEFMKYPLPGEAPVPLPYCGIREPQTGSRKEKRGWWKKVERYIQTHDPFSDRPKRPPLTPKPVCLPTEINVPVHFSIFTAEYSTSQLVTIGALEYQLYKLNQAYEPLKISFWIKSVHYHAGEQYRKFTQHRHNSASEEDDHANEAVKQAHHYGGTDELNVYIVESIDDLTCNDRSFIQTTGYCHFAHSLNTPGHATDGCVVIMDDIPDVSYRGQGATSGTGTTLVHEVGHWFGLAHTFATGEKCGGDSDSADDTIRFPSDPEYLFSANQPSCCFKGGRWSYCPGTGPGGYNVIHNSNWMSYSPDQGNGLSDDPGARPWTNDQRREMFVNYYTFRKREKEYNAKYVGKCFNGPVYDDLPKEFVTRDLDKRDPSTGIINRQIKSTKAITYRGSAMVETLKKVCAYPRVDGLFIDSVSGESVTCDESTGKCTPPSTGWRCLDGSYPPCSDYVPEKPYTLPSCKDGSAPPCAEPVPVCKGNQALICELPKGTTDPYNNCSTEIPGPKIPGDEKIDTSMCPKACDVHLNTCDATTAPSCIYPDPSVKNPRPACACRAGYKSSYYADTDSTKQWRLPVVGQEYRVWVAEGVKCDKTCNIAYGVDSCQEVTMIDKACIG